MENSKMKITQICNRRLNLNLSQSTFDAIEKIAIKDGRKPGSLARRILDEWVRLNKNKNNLTQKRKIQK
jgi:hypothetical protein